MATLTPDNPFDTQQPKATNTGIVGGAMQTAAPTAGQLPTNVGTSAPATPDVATYAPTTRQVNQPTDTVQGQVDSILAKDSPLMQRARTLATQQMAQRGLVNSSMAVGAGQAAMVDRALPMAQQDANAYNQAAQDNMNALNQSGQFNAGEINRFGLQKGEQQFQASQADINRQFQTSERLGSQSFTSDIEANRQGFTASQAQLDRAQQTALQLGQQEFQSAQAKLQNDFNMQMQTLQESGLDFRQARDIASREAMIQLEQMGITNRFDQELALKSQQFNIEQYNLDKRQLIANQNELDKLGLQIKANNAQIPTAFAANISNTAMTGVNAIMADGNLNADQKRAAIDNIVKYANSQIDWAAKFYGTAIPPITTPA